MSDHKERTRFSAELDEDIREMSKDNRIIEQSVLEKRLREENEAYEKYGIVPEVSEETYKKALEIMKEMGLEGRGDEDNSSGELATTQNVDTFGE
jgi:hypothetical protein